MRKSTAWRNLRADIERYRADEWLKGAWWIYERTVWAVVVYRFGQRILELPRFAQKVLGIPYAFIYAMAQVLTGIEIPAETSIGPGIRIYHGQGLVINAGTAIGEGVTLRQGVTIGARRIGEDACPVVGSNVVFGSYAQAYGAVRIGDGAILGALAVVLDDVPPHTTVVGSPARATSPPAC